MAEKLSADARSVTPADWERLRCIGLDDQACLELAHIVGIFNHLTRLADGFGLQVDRQTLAAAAGGPPLSTLKSARPE
jgi:alkylhydroperoxidase family enzyme